MENKSNAIDQPEQLLKGSQIAERLNISLALAYRLMQSGDIPTIRFNRTVRVRVIDLERFIKEHTTC